MNCALTTRASKNTNLIFNFNFLAKTTDIRRFYIITLTVHTASDRLAANILLFQSINYHFKASTKKHFVN